MCAMRPYLDLMQHVLEQGVYRDDRTGTGTDSVFVHQLRMDLAAGFPLLTTKKLHLKSIIHELIWFLSGDTNIGYLKENGVSIWDEWADEDGDLGPVYGKQWRSWPTPDGGHIDQIAAVLDRIKRTPDSRRRPVPGEMVKSTSSQKCDKGQRIAHRVPSDPAGPPAANSLMGEPRRTTPCNALARVGATFLR